MFKSFLVALFLAFFLVVCHAQEYCMVVSNDWGNNGSIDEKAFWYFSPEGLPLHVEHDFDSNGIIDDVEFYHYDVTGRLTGFDGDGSTFTYDAQGRVSKITYTIDGVVDWYIYDGAGTLIRIDRDSDGNGIVDWKEFRYYDALNRLDRAECDDDNDSLVDFTEFYVYNSNSIPRLKPWDYKNDSRVNREQTYLFDSFGNVAQINQDWCVNGTLEQKMFYSYRPLPSKPQVTISVQ